MKTYEVVLEIRMQTVYKTYTVEASDEEEAIAIAVERAESDLENIADIDLADVVDLTGDEES